MQSLRFDIDDDIDNLTSDNIIFPSFFSRFERRRRSPGTPHIVEMTALFGVVVIQ